jgi:hypothetical protein
MTAPSAPTSPYIDAAEYKSAVDSLLASPRDTALVIEADPGGGKSTNMIEDLSERLELGRLKRVAVFVPSTVDPSPDQKSLGNELKEKFDKKGIRASVVLGVKHKSSIDSDYKTQFAWNGNDQVKILSHRHLALAEDFDLVNRLCQEADLIVIDEDISGSLIETYLFDLDAAKAPDLYARALEIWQKHGPEAELSVRQHHQPGNRPWLALNGRAEPTGLFLPDGSALALLQLTADDFSELTANLKLQPNENDATDDAQNKRAQKLLEIILPSGKYDLCIELEKLNEGAPQPFKLKVRIASRINLPENCPPILVLDAYGKPDKYEKLLNRTTDHRDLSSKRKFKIDTILLKSQGFSKIAIDMAKKRRGYAETERGTELLRLVGLLIATELGNGNAKSTLVGYKNHLDELLPHIKEAYQEIWEKSMDMDKLGYFTLRGTNQLIGNNAYLVMFPYSNTAAGLLEAGAIYPETDQEESRRTWHDRKVAEEFLQTAARSRPLQNENVRITVLADELPNSKEIVKFLEEKVEFRDWKSFQARIHSKCPVVDFAIFIALAELMKSLEVTDHDVALKNKDKYLLPAIPISVLTKLGLVIKGSIKEASRYCELLEKELAPNGEDHRLLGAAIRWLLYGIRPPDLPASFIGTRTKLDSQNLAAIAPWLEKTLGLKLDGDLLILPGADKAAVRKLKLRLAPKTSRKRKPKKTRAKAAKILSSTTRNTD